MEVQTPMIRILIVDDHIIVRRGLKAFLAQIDDIQVIGEADNGLEAVRLSRELEPDVILMDLLMPKLDGIEATRQIIIDQPHMRALVMTSFVCDDKIFPAIKAGALGCVLKESDPGELRWSIHKVHCGELPLPASIARKMMKEIVETPVENPTPDPLTARERGGGGGGGDWRSTIVDLTLLSADDNWAGYPSPVDR